MLPTDTEVTRTNETQELYREHYTRLERACRSKSGGAPDSQVTPQQVASHFLETERDWSKATAKLYRAALAYVFKGLGTPAAQDAHDMIYRVHEDPADVAQKREMFATLRRVQRRNKPNTSAQKSKSISIEDLDQLREAIDQCRSKYSRATKLWFVAGILTGLRPCEWETAQLRTEDESRVVLVVNNAKNTNGRSHGKERKIDLTNLSEDNLKLIRAHLDSVKIFVEEMGYKSFYDACRSLLHTITNRLWSRRRTRPSLYTARHVFGATAKKHLDRIAVAALMGHASTETAFQHYGRRHRGWGAMDVVPDPADIAAVAAKNTQRLPRP